MAAHRDAEMHSSPTSSFDAEDEADLFPESTTATSNPPVQNNHLNAAAPGELSPPRSQGSEEEPDAGTSSPAGVNDDNTNGHSTMEQRREEMERMPGTNINTNANGEGRGYEAAKPGSGWNNKRAQEEYQRAWDTVLDKDFNLHEFGDVMAVDGQPPRKEG